MKEHKSKKRGREASAKSDAVVPLALIPAQKMAKIAFSQQTSDEAPRHVNTIEYDGKACTHEVAWPPGHEGPLGPPAAPSKPPAKEYSFAIDPFQRTAIHALEAGHNVLVAAHTSAGKTVVAQYAFAMGLRDRAKVVYTSPLKALSNQKFRELQEEFGDVGLMTGDVTINPDAHCLVMTTEILRSMLYRGSEIVREMKLVVYDEIHYMRDKERGVVWEETIVLAPKGVRFAFLSATLPNSFEFAQWIAKVHGSPCDVTYTDYRPTPLQHYLFPEGGDGLYLTMDAGRFREDNFQKAVADLNDAQVAGGKKQGAAREAKVTEQDQQRADMLKLVRMIIERNYDPVIVFAFSKRDCEKHALALSSLELNNEDEQKLVETIFWSALGMLAPEDQALAQVREILPMLKRGVGVHHSGLIPILKEVIEILFQENLLKCLFATETFSTGLNMPAKTVVFTGLRKYDGGGFRWISPGEYIQMSGRAGRRGLDDRGVVIMMMSPALDPATAKGLLQGSADLMYSEFRLGYNMLLNMMRLEGSKPEEIMSRSFRQFQAERAIPGLERRLAQLEASLRDRVIPQEEELQLLYDTVEQLLVQRRALRELIAAPKRCVPFLQPGRAVQVLTAADPGAPVSGTQVVGACRQCAAAAKKAGGKVPAGAGTEEAVWGLIVSFRREGSGGKAKSKGTEDSPPESYTVDVLLKLRSDTVPRHGQADWDKVPVPVDPLTGEGIMAVVPVKLRSVAALSAVRVHLPRDLRQQHACDNAGKALGEVLRRFGDAVPVLDPVGDMGADKKKVEKCTGALKQLNDMLNVQEVLGAADLGDRLEALREKHVDKEALGVAKRELRAAKGLVLKKELHARQRILRQLGHVDENGIVTLKGRVACEISSGDELVLSELVFGGVLNALTDEQVVALLSCFVWTEKGGRGGVKIREDLQGTFAALREAARTVGRAVAGCGLPVDVEEFVESFRPDLMEACAAWHRGVKFSGVLKLADVFEGSLVRAIRRLSELLTQLGVAATNIGETELSHKMETIGERLRRDIIFAASLYL
ncbi:unnamed protein product [Pedinophyceae sp. YPF-701]|nr:unnamed protein product [Pedinophyceae sp. YPF-701]